MVRRALPRPTGLCPDSVPEQGTERGTISTVTFMVLSFPVCESEPLALPASQTSQTQNMGCAVQMSVLLQMLQVAIWEHLVLRCVIQRNASWSDLLLGELSLLVPKHIRPRGTHMATNQPRPLSGHSRYLLTSLQHHSTVHIGNVVSS